MNSSLHRDLDSKGMSHRKFHEIKSIGQNSLKNGLGIDEKAGVLDKCDLALSNSSIGRLKIVGDEIIKEYVQRLKQLQADALGSGCSARRYTLLLKKYVEE